MASPCLDPERDHLAIMRRLFGGEFAAEIRLGAGLALFRVFAIPQISGILAETRAWERRPQQRLGRTVDLLRVLVEQGYDSGPGAAALARLNAVHARHAIANEDFVYVLTAFVTEPARVIARCGTRPLDAIEREAACVFWREVGVRMGIRDVPRTFAAMRAFQAQYEAAHRRYAASNRCTAEGAMSAISQRVPGPLRGAVREGLLALLEPEVRRACGFAGEERAMGRVLDVVMAVRRRFAFTGWN
ncbi:oxygenase MpaB family protein [Nannocystis pusilla]|uniref:oxygenase MpaB family protein n=1 Tax=Nannocystis pusilla TaxID=889268 RepID=UPI003BF3D42B